MTGSFDFICAECAMVSVIRFQSRAEAGYYVDLHDRLQHAGHPTCQVRTVVAPPEQRQHRDAPVPPAPRTYLPAPPQRPAQDGSPAPPIRQSRRM